MFCFLFFQIKIVLLHKPNTLFVIHVHIFMFYTCKFMFMIICRYRSSSMETECRGRKYLFVFIDKFEIQNQILNTSHVAEVSEFT